MPEEHPDSRPDKGTLAAGTEEPKQICAPCYSWCAPTPAQEEVVWMHTLLHGTGRPSSCIWSPSLALRLLETVQPMLHPALGSVGQGQTCASILDDLH